MPETGKSFIKKFVSFSLVTWISFALSFISAPISTRLFEPAVLGKINIFNTYSNLFGMIVLLGLDQSYVRFFHEKSGNITKGYLFTFCVAITYSFLLASFVLAIPFRDSLSWLVFQEKDNLLFYLFFLSVFCSSTLRYLNLTYRMEQNIKMYTIQGVLMAIVSKILYICVGFWDPSYRSALIVLAISHFALALVFLFIQHNRFEIIREWDKKFSNEMFAFALPALPASVLMWANSSVPQLIMQHTMDYYYIGIFTSAMAIANVILVIQSGFNTFWVPYTYENYKTQTGQFFKVHRYLMCALTIFALLLICSQDVVFMLLGEKYRPAKAFFPFLCLGPVCYIAGEIGGIGIGISKKSYLKLYVFIASITVNIIGCLLLGKTFGVAGIAIATALAGVTSMTVMTVLGNKYYKVIINYKYIIACIFLIIVGAFITLLVEDIILRICLSITCLFVALVFYKTEIQELWQVALSFIKHKQ